ncbi:TPA: hypothetical protein QDZ99_001924 [Stenotrophomonas maltophilia]|uniref:Secreted protein n=1 Tax=Stenotrophomonas maltophilia TaxID=40324 RepID=A0AAI9C3A7_STEMA|nr:hypothetical protein [Stenotrophomonas maltophilia]UUS14546.1 hypothetical protein NMB32_23760 [Stenotrophomonas sp. CD2]HDS1128075.1 hypothetical protein [Stenotrophomonas maltophilia]HDS1155684.1 hypothetical protein [Stenotrophomonas maltophilia]HDS1164305.1 hypothetical protein [Stenotrophomonas maltophilia]
MLSVLIAITLAAGSPQASSIPAASAAYADCLLAHLQPGLSDRAVQLVQQACASKYPESFVASMELERRMSAQRRADFEAAQAEAARSANAAATAAQEAADAAAAKAKGMWAK